MKTQTGGAVIPDATNKRLVEQKAADRWAKARVNAMHLLFDGQITEAEEKVLSDLAYKEYNEATSEPVLKLADLLKPRPLNFGD